MTEPPILNTVLEWKIGTGMEGTPVVNLAVRHGPRPNALAGSQDEWTWLALTPQQASALVDDIVQRLYRPQPLRRFDT